MKEGHGEEKKKALNGKGKGRGGLRGEDDQEFGAQECSDCSLSVTNTHECGKGDCNMQICLKNGGMEGPENLT